MAHKAHRRAVAGRCGSEREPVVFGRENAAQLTLCAEPTSPTTVSLSLTISSICQRDRDRERKAGVNEYLTRGSAFRKAVQQSCLREDRRPSARPSRTGVRKSRHQVYLSRRWRETQSVKEHGKERARDTGIAHGKEKMLGVRRRRFFEETTVVSYTRL